MRRLLTALSGVLFGLTLHRAFAPVTDPDTGWTNVRAAPYNAVGNGIADDTQPIQAAVQDIATAGGGVLFFPPGTYSLSQGIELPSNIVVQGSGMGVSKLRIALGTASTAALYTSETNSRHHVTVQDLSLDCNEPGPTIYPIQLSTTTEFRIARVEASNFTDGIVMRRWSSRGSVSSCLVRNVKGHGISVSGSDQTVAQSYFAQQLRISDCIVVDSGNPGTPASGAGINLHRAVWATVTGNIFSYTVPTYSPHGFAGIRTSNSTTNVAIGGNVVFRHPGGVTLNGRASTPPLLNEVDPETSVFGNVVAETRTAGITLTGGRHVVVGNAVREGFTQIHAGMDDWEKCSCLLWQNVIWPPELCVLSHNCFSDVAPTIRLYGVCSALVSGLRPDWNILSNNRIRGFLTTDVRVDSANNTLVQHNLSVPN